DRRGLRDRRAQAQRIEDEMDVPLDGPERAQREALEPDAGGRDERRLEPAMPAEPAQLSSVRAREERPGDGEGRVDVPARAPARDQQAHRSSFPSPRSPGSPTAAPR